MLIRGLRQLFLIALPAFLVLLIGASLFQQNNFSLSYGNDLWPSTGDTFPDDAVPQNSEPNTPPGVKIVNDKPVDQLEPGETKDQAALQEAFFKELARMRDEQRKKKLEANGGKLTPEEEAEEEAEARKKKPFDLAKTHRQIYSLSTSHKKYFVIDYGDYKAYNANLLPHPHLNDTWVVVAQQMSDYPWATVWFAQLVCNAYFKNDKMVCHKTPLLLPITNTFTDKCTGKVSYFGFNNGPHDARIFYGPDEPFTIFGSQSQWTCFGQFMQDLRTLVDWGFEYFDKDKYRQATELAKPFGYTYGTIEKNWFVFWDDKGDMYTHHDMAPKRIFSKTEKNGAQGKDLAPLAAHNDDKCLKKLMPYVGPTLESIHQATNSLSVTLCKRSDPSCKPDNSNTFIMTIFHYKSFFDFHGIYEPYVMLFRRTSPFEVHGISSKPLWISGRGKPGEKTGTPKDETRPKDQSEMLYITSMSWKQKGLKYHGYADDVMFLGFGVEDSKAGIIDFVVGDILQDIALCSTA